MLVLFKDNYECVIKGIATLRIGDMLCELLNLNMNELKKLGNDLLTLLHSVDPTKDEIFESNVQNYISVIKKKSALINYYRTQMENLPFYKYTNDVNVAFELFDAFIDDMRAQLKHRSPDAIIADASISFGIKSYKEAITNIIKLIEVIFQTYKQFLSIVDLCLLYDTAPVGDKPIKKLKQYGLEKFNKQVIPAIKNTQTTALSSLSLMYELIGDEENLSLVQCFDFGTLPQYIYHEFMQMVSLNLYVRRCKNCGKYFVIYGDRILEYCNNVPKGETKSCTVIGPARQYAQRVRTDPILEIYTRAYKKYVARKRAGNISPDAFKAWTVKARALRDKAYAEKTPPEVFAEWLQ